MGLKFRFTIIWKTEYVNQPNDARQSVSLNMPDPHIITLGKYKIAIASWRIKVGYMPANALNMAQLPEKESRAKIIAVGRYVVPKKMLIKAAMDETI